MRVASERLSTINPQKKSIPRQGGQAITQVARIQRANDPFEKQEPQVTQKNTERSPIKFSPDLSIRIENFHLENMVNK